MFIWSKWNHFKFIFEFRNHTFCKRYFNIDRIARQTTWVCSWIWIKYEQENCRRRLLLLDSHQRIELGSKLHIHTSSKGYNLIGSRQIQLHQNGYTRRTILQSFENLTLIKRFFQKQFFEQNFYEESQITRQQAATSKIYFCHNCSSRPK